MNPDLPPELALLEAQLVQLFAQVDSGGLSPEQAQPALDALFVFDAAGNRWSVGWSHRSDLIVLRFEGRRHALNAQSVLEELAEFFLEFFKEAEMKNPASFYVRTTTPAMGWREVSS